MSKTQLVIIAGAIGLVVLMFLLPKVIINKDNKEDLTAPVAANRDAGAEEEDHTGHDHAPGEGHGEADLHATATPEQQKELSLLRTAFSREQSAAEKQKIAEQLAEKYSAVAKYDSSGYYYEQVALLGPGVKAYEKAADQYFEAFSYAATQQRANELGQKARELYEKVLKNDPANLNAKTNVAMTYIATENPMQGIMLLREVIATDPNNEKALFNLGVLSIQSGQYDKALERFRKLVAVNPKSVNGNFYLGVSLAETGQKEEAIKVFNKVKQLESDPALHASVDEYLKKLNQQ
ncbi:MAG: tetratricopeptide repeat protein [Hymenobacteraceae bacterium]|nr:tetratricopeptide repeat protein [Hymenobacteraceae bacterium]